jgi:polysaccharide export outer membrane protein
VDGLVQPLHRKLLIALGLSLAAFLATACASSAGVVNLRDFKTTAAPAAQERIGPGDLLAIRVWNSEQMTSRQRVRPDGTVVMFFMDSLPVAGLTTSAVAVEITRRLDGVFVAPRVSVVIEESAASVITLLGEVRRPGTYPVTRPVTMLEALALGSGLTEYAKQSRIFLLRDGTRLRIRYDELLRGDDRAHGLLVRPGDVVVVE